MNISKTGAFISNLRKAKDMTQVELADRLYITHQAVSKWERGESMPEITLLPKLADLLGATVDELLQGEKAPVPPAGDTSQPQPGLGDRLAHNELDEAAHIINEEKQAIDALIEMAPMLKASVLDQVTRKVESERFALHDIAHLAPFLSTEAVDDLVKQVYELQPDDMHHVGALAPFVSGDVLYDIAVKAAKQTGGSVKLAPLAPFLSKEQLESLVKQGGAAVTDKRTLLTLAPFLGSDFLQKMIHDMIAAKFNPVENTPPDQTVANEKRDE
jgi:transcriptional regulator with XRE-family HTH domain